jgi:uncharacterized membrane protein
MEIVLLIFTIAFLLIIRNTIIARFDKLDDKLDALNRKINLLQGTEKPIEKVIQKTMEKIEPQAIIEKEKPIPTIAEVKPPIAIPIPKPAEEKEKVVFSMDNVAKRKPLAKPYVPPIQEQTFWENFKEKNPDLEKFIGENLISKIGILILVLGISYLVKFSIDKGWINEPARVGIGILSGALVMGVAHKLRQKYSAFSSIFVAGAIAIFYFTIGIAFHQYHLFNQTVAFIIMVVITGFSCLISLSYNRIELAVLSLIGGFSVPFMVSTGSGNYVVLFTYILILNLGILTMAYYKKWNLVNILAFAFTVILFSGWLIKEINLEKPHYLGAFCFAFIFYFVFVLTNIINNLSNKGEFSKTQLFLLTANTFLFYAAGMIILQNYHAELRGLFTASISVLNLLYAWFLFKKFGLDKNAVYLLLGLTLTFITLAVPVQFKGNYITLFWAGEAVLLIWLAQKSKIVSYRFGSIIVQFLMLISLLMDWVKIYGSNQILNIAINPIFITGIVAVASLFFVYFLLKNETDSCKQFGITFNLILYRKFIFIVGLGVSYLVGILEVSYQANDFISEWSSVVSLPIVFHLLFCAGLYYFMSKKTTPTIQNLAKILASLNIILYAFLCMTFVFEEQKAYVSGFITNQIAFYLHYISLLIVIYFGYQLYTKNKENSFFSNSNQMFTWIGTFFIVYIASSELMLHGLMALNTPITVEDLKASALYNDYKNGSLDFLKGLVASEKIELYRTKILKTGFPVLWGILAFLFLIIGIKKEFKTLRVVALTLLGLTIVKLFFFDISNVSKPGKIIAFILLGVLVLIIAFVYQKTKARELENAKTTKEIEETDENN